MSQRDIIDEIVRNWARDERLHGYISANTLTILIARLDKGLSSPANIINKKYDVVRGDGKVVKVTIPKD